MSSPPNTAAARVVDTAELLELILIQCSSPSDVTRNRGVNRFFKAMIDNSKKLACARVVGNKLLLERILNHIKSASEITRARQVNSYFKTAIDESKKLRLLLFLVPQPIHAIVKCDPGQRWLAFDPRGYTYSRDVESYKHDTDFILMELHPAISVELTTNSPISTSGFTATIDSEIFASSPAEGILKSMFICQPPCPGFEIHCRAPSRPARACCECIGHLTVAGNTLGALSDAMRHFWGCDGIKELYIRGFRDQQDSFLQLAQNSYWSRQSVSESGMEGLQIDQRLSLG